MRLLLIAFTFFLVSLTGAVVFAQDAVRNIDITQESDIADAAAVSAILSTLTKDVTACAQVNQPPAECQCKYKDQLGQLKTAYDAAIKKHPDWAGAMVNYRTLGQREGTSLSFAGIAQQLNVCK
ncbi:MAG: hypothetical protein IT560_12620 [Alphaproteobacteria bacterium]|nr:hypothetical protein [Alphaproteobacteria bacterium]